MMSHNNRSRRSFLKATAGGVFVTFAAVSLRQGVMPHELDWSEIRGV